MWQSLATLGRGAMLCVVLAGMAAVANAADPMARPVQSVAVSRDGKMVAFSYTGPSNGRFPLTPHPDLHHRGGVEVWRVRDGLRRELVHRFDEYGDIPQVAFSPDGKWLAYYRLYTPGDSVRDDVVRVFDLATGKQVLKRDGATTFAFSPTGELLAVTSYTCFFYPLPKLDGAEIDVLDRSRSLTFSGDGRLLAGVHRGRLGGTVVEIFEPDAAEPFTTKPLGHRDEIYFTAAFAPDGKSIATGHADGSAIVWDVATGETLRRLETGAMGLVHPFYSPDGKLLGGGRVKDGTVVIWDADTGRERFRHTFERPEFSTTYARFRGSKNCPERAPHRFVFMPDGKSLLTACDGGTILPLNLADELPPADRP